MNKRLLEEVSRQKELMNLNEQSIMGDIADKVVGSLSNSILKSIFKNTLNPDNEDDDDEDGETETSTSDTEYNKLSTTDFDNEVNRVIDNLEGGYYHPNMKKSDMGKSGETMMGMDRKYGAGFAQTSAGKEFWKLIDDANAKNNWKWNYMGGPLESRLRALVTKMIQPEYERLSNRYLNEKAREIVKKSPNLMFHFIYATWNGAGWFQKFANKINEAVDEGVTKISDLESIAMKSRKESGNSIIASGGQKISKLLGIKNM
jgi:hypothetical protein